MTPKLLVTASSFAHIQNFHLPYLRAFHALGWEIHVACGGEERALPCADRLIRLPLKKRLLAPQNLSASLLLRREMIAQSYTLVITHTALASFFTRLALMSVPKRPRCINVVHGYLFDDETGALKGTLYRAAEHLVSGVTDQILTMNQYDLAWAKKRFPGTPVEYIPGMGADEARIRSAHRHDFGFPAGSVTLIFPAEFSQRKNQSALIRAMAQLPESVYLVLPGDGALLNECRALAKALGVADRVVFPGHVKEIVPLLKGADVAVSSSRIEGLPFNLIEAMQCGLPIIASRVKGNSDLVEEGVNGLLYAYDDADAFAAAVQRLAGDAALRRRMGEESLARAQALGLEAVCPQVMAAYLSGCARAE